MGAAHCARRRADTRTGAGRLVEAGIVTSTEESAAFVARLRDGATVTTAIVDGAKGRFRPIFLTSLTTFLGFMPLLLESAVQARLLVPFAASMGFGIAIASVILMLVVPALVAAFFLVAPSRGSVGAAHPATAG